MLTITIPNNNIEERKYIIDIIFKEFLGIKYKIKIGTDDYQILLQNGNKLIIKDYFFNKFPNNLEYLNINNIPSKVDFIKNNFTKEKDIPVIYGDSFIDIQSSLLVCGIDIFASSFFMLSRWEEYVNMKRDIHNRFPATESLAYKNNFLSRPIVNEYVEMLWNILKFLGCNQNRKKRNFEIILTHDIDNILLFNSCSDLIKRIGGDIINRKNLFMPIKTIFNFILVKAKIIKDPNDTFDWLMNLSEKIGSKSYFFFMAQGKTKYDNRYKSDSVFVKKLVNKIQNRGHYIGIHPTYNAYNNIKQLQKEKKELEKNLETKIDFGREHYLRFEIPTTWQIWEDSEMVWDSTVGYSDKEGFRCGVCYEYSVFNILTRKKLLLKEKPLIVMDVTVLNQSNTLELINTNLEKVIKYNGQFVFLWHNSNFLDNKSKIIYSNIINNLVFLKRNNEN